MKKASTPTDNRSTFWLHFGHHKIDMLLLEFGALKRMLNLCSDKGIKKFTKKKKKKKDKGIKERN